MLEATGDGMDELHALSRTEGPPTVVMPGDANRMVYKLVKVGDDGSVLAATEDEVFQSLVGGSGSGHSPFVPEGEDDEDEEGSDYAASVDLVSDGKDGVCLLEDLAAEREKLRTRLEMLDTMLLTLDGEEQQRINTGEDLAGNGLGLVSNSSPYFSVGDGIAEYKRQRRPNPKYLNLEAGYDSAFVLPTPTLSSGEHIIPQLLPEKSPSKAAVKSPRGMSAWGSHCSSVRSASTHRARTTITQKPFTRTSMKVDASGSIGLALSSASSIQELSLENLSIRELHEAFRLTYGRETSVKDKHWLKRQISAGWMMQPDALFHSTSQLPVLDILKARLEVQIPAEQPLPSVATTSTGATERDNANEAQVQERNREKRLKELIGKGPERNNSMQPTASRPVGSLGGSFDISSPRRWNNSSAAGGQIAIFGEVVNTGEPLEGKRHRKPNRRYFEDGGETASDSTSIKRRRPVFWDSAGDSLGLSRRLAWKTLDTDGSSDTVGGHETLRSGLQNTSGANPSSVQQPKPMIGNMDVSIELTRGTGDNVAVLPVLPVDSSGILQSLPLNSREEGEQPIATVPTANGGTRRKHHRPWTLREVMTLVEGVAQCGGGKWADIKKLAFAAIGYRTAVDLKDKWRNLLRASRAQLHPPKQGERKKQFSAAIPAPLLARVRELAALQNRTPSACSGGSTSRSGRIVHRN